MSLILLLLLLLLLKRDRRESWVEHLEVTVREDVRVSHSIGSVRGSVKVDDIGPRLDVGSDDCARAQDVSIERMGTSSSLSGVEWL